MAGDSSSIPLSSPIGVIDSGVGGLTRVAQLSSLLPGENIIYCGDNGNAPYGNRSGEEIVELTTNMLAFLADQNVKLVAVACNTISSTFDLPEFAGYEKQFGFPVLSIIRSAAEDVVALRYTKVGVIATAFTIASKCYPTLIDELEGDIDVYREPSEKLAALIEQGDLKSPAIDAEVGNHVANLLGAHPDVRDIVLGCTHYPIVESIVSGEGAARGVHQSGRIAGACCAGEPQERGIAVPRASRERRQSRHQHERQPPRVRHRAWRAERDASVQPQRRRLRFI